MATFLLKKNAVPETGGVPAEIPIQRPEDCGIV